MAQRRSIGLIPLLLWLLIQNAAFASSEVIGDPYSKYPHVKVLVTTYPAHRFSDIGCYRRVSKNGKRLGEFVALNFLPGGSVVMIPELLKTTKLTVADTFGKSGIGHYKGKKYWKVDILRNKQEWIDDFDYPLNLYVVKYNAKGPVKDAGVRRNCQRFLKKGNP